MAGVDELTTFLFLFPTRNPTGMTIEEVGGKNQNKPIQNNNNTKQKQQNPTAKSKGPQTEEENQLRTFNQAESKQIVN